MLISKPLSEVVGDLVSERTSPRDLVQLYVTYLHGAKPEFTLVFSTLDETKKHHPEQEDISMWVKDYDSPRYHGDGTLDKNYVPPFSSWEDAVTGVRGISQTVASIVQANGVRYELVVR